VHQDLTHIKDAKKVAKSSGILGLGEIPMQVLTLLSGIIVTRVLGAEKFGVYVAAATVVGVGVLIGTMGFNQGVVRFIGIYRDSQTRVMGIIHFALISTLLFGSLVAVILTLCAPFLETYVFQIPGVGRIIALLSITVPLISVFTVVTSCIQAFEEITYVTLLQKVMQPSIRLLLLIGFFLAGARLSALVMRDIFAGMILVVVAFYYLNRRFPPFRKNQRADYSLKTEMFSFTMPLFLAELVHVIMLRIDVLMISAFLGASDVGVYGIVLRISNLLMVPLMSLDAIIYPMMASAFGQKAMDDIERLYKLSSHWVMLIMTPVVVIALVFTRDILAFFGPEFVTGATALRLIAIGVTFRIAAGCVAGVLLMGGHSKLIFYNSLGALVFNVVANYHLVPRYGIVGAALATGVVMTLWGVIMVVEVFVIYRFVFWTKSTFNVLLAAGSVMAVFLLVPVSGHYALRLTVGTLAATVLSFAVMVLFRCLSDQDWEIIRKTRTKLKLPI